MSHQEIDQTLEVLTGANKRHPTNNNLRNGYYNPYLLQEKCNFNNQKDDDITVHQLQGLGTTAIVVTRSYGMINGGNGFSKLLGFSNTYRDKGPPTDPLVQYGTVFSRKSGREGYFVVIDPRTTRCTCCQRIWNGTDVTDEVERAPSVIRFELAKLVVFDVKPNVEKWPFLPESVKEVFEEAAEEASGTSGFIHPLTQS
ncbi:uncharacterized protein BDR25DRAFT_319945 [Lindgomyces ingoldianus]|uniref:Uncharacterized protein n=1 Tax=Lindgomyces ingoldianus TaxID=673940 RepID=A0ACB6QA70_9PLEO|nr:uncharacterized protein BDR25DRAFT_319945 [Lindgomyces ingoldianus]KAF2463420.1 hypothetical protein BDR25DRAFT_319945 [Lindgomyces ingoldianus]